MPVSLLNDLNSRSITEGLADKLRDVLSPLLVDKKFRNQFGFRTSTDIEKFRRAIIRGSGEVIQ